MKIRLTSAKAFVELGLRLSLAIKKEDNCEYYCEYFTMEP